MHGPEFPEMLDWTRENAVKIISQPFYDVNADSKRAPHLQIATDSIAALKKTGNHQQQFKNHCEAGLCTRFKSMDVSVQIGAEATEPIWVVF